MRVYQTVDGWWFEVLEGGRWLRSPESYSSASEARRQGRLYRDGLQVLQVVDSE